jgi:hypothetical protein
MARKKHPGARPDPTRCRVIKISRHSYAVACEDFCFPDYGPPFTCIDLAESRTRYRRAHEALDSLLQHHVATRR